MRTIAVLPVKRFGGAKQRLAAELSPADRRELAEAMLEDVLAALSSVAELDQVVVVSAEPHARALAVARRLQWVDDPLGAGQSAAALLGIARARELHAQRVLLVPGDCPALDPKEVSALLAPSTEREVAIVPDRHGTGTNALLLAPPDVIEPAFGSGSRERHEGLARYAGVTPRLAELPSLGLDVDTLDDLFELWALHRRRPLRGGRAAGIVARAAATARAARR